MYSGVPQTCGDKDQFQCPDKTDKTGNLKSFIMGNFLQIFFEGSVHPNTKITSVPLIPKKHAAIQICRCEFFHHLNAKKKGELNTKLKNAKYNSDVLFQIQYHGISGQLLQMMSDWKQRKGLWTIQVNETNFQWGRFKMYSKWNSTINMCFVI